VCIHWKFDGLKGKNRSLIIKITIIPRKLWDTLPGKEELKPLKN